MSAAAKRETESDSVDRADTEPAVTAIDDWLPYRLSKAASRVGDILFAYYSKKYGLSRAGWKTLAILAGKPGLNAGEIVRATGSDPYAISRAVSQLQQRGLIDRRASEYDKRFISVQLTPAGETVFRDIWALSARIEEEIFGVLNDTQLTALEQIVAVLERTGQQVEQRGWQALASANPRQGEDQK